MERTASKSTTPMRFLGFEGGAEKRRCYLKREGVSDLEQRPLAGSRTTECAGAGVTALGTRATASHPSKTAPSFVPAQDPGARCIGAAGNAAQAFQ